MAKTKKVGKRTNIEKIFRTKVSEIDSKTISAGDAATAALLKKLPPPMCEIIQG